MAILTEIRQAICTNITNAVAPPLAALTPPVSFQALPGPVGNPDPPFCWVLREQTQPHQSFQEDDDMITLIVQVCVALGDSLDSQALLDEFTGSGDLSIRNAIETADGGTGQTTLGGLIADLIVREISRDQIMVFPGQGASAQYLGAEFTVDIYTGGS